MRKILLPLRLRSKQHAVLRPGTHHLAGAIRWFKTAADCSALRLRSQRHELSLYIAIGADGVDGKTQLAAPWQPACRRRHVPGNPLLTENSTVVPVAHQHVFHAKLVQ